MVDEPNTSTKAILSTVKARNKRKNDQETLEERLKRLKKRDLRVGEVNIIN